MNVRRLIRALEAMPAGAKVLTEGCDCHGDAAHVVLDEGTVLITRSRSESRYWDAVKPRRRRPVIVGEYRSREPESWHGEEPTDEDLELFGLVRVGGEG